MLGSLHVRGASGDGRATDITDVKCARPRTRRADRHVCHWLHRCKQQPNICSPSGPHCRGCDRSGVSTRVQRAVGCPLPATRSLVDAGVPVQCTSEVVEKRTRFGRLEFPGSLTRCLRCYNTPSSWIQAEAQTEGGATNGDLVVPRASSHGPSKASMLGRMSCCFLAEIMGVPELPVNYAMNHEALGVLTTWSEVKRECTMVE